MCQSGDELCLSGSCWYFFSIEGEFVPIPGDEVTYQMCLVPPKNERYQAVHVKITHLKEGEVHHRWDGTTV